jgi:hypothetical protein
VGKWLFKIYENVVLKKVVFIPTFLFWFDFNVKKNRTKLYYCINKIINYYYYFFLLLILLNNLNYFYHYYF